MEKNYTDKELELVFEKILKMYKSSYSPKEKPKLRLLFLKKIQKFSC